MVEDLISKEKTLNNERNQVLDCMEEICENLDDVQQSFSQLSSDYATRDGGMFLSQCQQIWNSNMKEVDKMGSYLIFLKKNQW